MKKRSNYLKHALQWGVLAALVTTALWGRAADTAVDFERYCPFGGLQALGTYLVRNSLACSMSMLQIAMGGALAFGVVLFSKLFCGYLCPLGTVTEALGRLGRRLGVQVTVPPGSLADRALRTVKYVLLFVILCNTLSASELFCRKLDPYYAVVTGFRGEIVLWMSLATLALLLAGGLFVRMFWCRYICPLGAASNLFKYAWLLLAGVVAAWGLGALGVAPAWPWVVGGCCLAACALEVGTLRATPFPLLAVVRDAGHCNGCSLCERRCPSQIPIRDFGRVCHVDCTLCGECVAACPHGALQVGGCRAWRWMPGLLAVALFLAALWLGSSLELPTIDERWGDRAQAAQIDHYRLDGLRTIKCYGSSKALSAKLQEVDGVYGVRTFVRRHGVEIAYDPAVTDTVRLRAALFTPTARRFAEPADSTVQVARFELGVEGLFDRMDMACFAASLRRVEGLYGFTAAFACPVAVTLYADPAACVTEERLVEVVEDRELVTVGKRGERIVYPMHYELRSFTPAGEVSAAEFRRLFAGTK